MPQNWKSLLQRAADTREVLAIARDYLAMLSPAEVASLPRRLQPSKIVDAEDLASYAFDMVRYHTECSGEAGDLCARLSEFLSHANQRATQLMRTPNAEQAEGQRRA